MNVIIPDGYEPFVEDSGYIGHNGPYYVKYMNNGICKYGFATNEHHANPNNVIHGAALTGFADTALGHTIVKESGRYCATISLTTEFISAAAVGSWVEASVRIKRMTNSLVFVSADVYSEDNILLTATGVFRLFNAS
ncbi:PaaI family thioesterase [Sneathiella sp. HT1-7]|uniref:PaaI family thioesterase n=1 Tax=Sneathiella sp. HT1-7 TaxID=2887192 RepID=UPI001D151280|nr:PaaI family thioesterase [Sneathiella sp. HT1-7]MCC3306742.1 PaaI family thioesterase [Sneathiella sp. HT1-7]